MVQPLGNEDANRGCFTMKLIKLFSILMVASVATVWAQDPQTTGTSCCPMMGQGWNMMEWHQKALDKFKAQNAEMDSLVQAMNSAQGQAKVDAIAAVINKAMEQRKAWQADMEEHQKKVMEWMKNRPMQKGAMPSVTP